MLVGVSSLALLACVGHAPRRRLWISTPTPANGAESQCDLNVLQTFPVQVENRVTNKSGGDAFGFSWPSAGPRRVHVEHHRRNPGRRRRKVGLDDQPVGLLVHREQLRQRRLLHEDGRARSLPSACSLRLRRRRRGAHHRQEAPARPRRRLSWPGGQGPFTIFRSTSPQSISDPGNALTTTSFVPVHRRPACGSDLLLPGPRARLPRPQALLHRRRLQPRDRRDMRQPRAVRRSGPLPARERT